VDYNEIWTEQKFIEYRKLKRSGYTDRMLIEHFGDDIYYSGMYNKYGSSLPVILKFGKFLNEIKVTPNSTNYSFVKQPSKFIEGESDYIISFFSNNIPYIICLSFFPINNKKTYNIIFTTRDQWNDYEYNLMNFLTKGNLTDDEFKILNDIISKETKLNDLFPILKKVSWVLLDFYQKNIKGELLSIGDIDNKKKINLYKNVIKDSFKNIHENKDYIFKYKYYIYEIN
jgi:hypothetical protein